MYSGQRFAISQCFLYVYIFVTCIFCFICIFFLSFFGQSCGLWVVGLLSTGPTMSSFICFLNHLLVFGSFLRSFENSTEIQCFFLTSPKFERSPIFKSNSGIGDSSALAWSSDGPTSAFAWPPLPARPPPCLWSRGRLCHQFGDSGPEYRLSPPSGLRGTTGP